MAKPKIIHIQPANGGVAAYAEIINAIYKRAGYQLQVIPFTDYQIARRLLVDSDADLLHFEVGAGDSRILALSRDFLRSRKTPQLITVHDSGVVVRHPVEVALADAHNSAIRFAGRVVRKLLSKTIGPWIIAQQLNHPSVSKLYLRSDLATGPRSYFLPHPVFNSVRPKPNHSHAKTVGFSGFWGPGKGIETLLAAWELLGEATDLELVVSGGTGSPSDPYGQEITQLINNAHRPITLAGFIADEKLDDFLQQLGVLILPYWPELPNGISGMAVRAAALGVPVIASDVPSLKEELGPEGAYYVPPKNAELLAEAMQTFAQNPKPFFERANDAQDLIYHTSSWKQVGSQLEKIITSATGEQS